MKFLPTLFTAVAAVTGTAILTGMGWDQTLLALWIIPSAVFTCRVVAEMIAQSLWGPTRNGIDISNDTCPNCKARGSISEVTSNIPDIRVAVCRDCNNHYAVTLGHDGIEARIVDPLNEEDRVPADEYLTDGNGNRAGIAHFGSREAAQAALDSLTACRNCTNCYACTKCRQCTECHGCTQCHGCTGCQWCTACEDCESCIHCEDCEDCVACRNCSHCDNLSKVRDKKWTKHP